jgi:hypothetical protein
MKSPLKRLEYNKALTNKDPGGLGKGFVLEKREQFRRNPPIGVDVSYLLNLFSNDLIICKNYSSKNI